MAETSLWQRLLRFLGLDGRPPAPPALPPAARPPEARPEPGFNFDDERIPEASRQRVARIRVLIDDLEKRALDRDLVSEVAELRRIRAAHLPKLLQSYIDIPPEHRAEVFRETGRSASFLLNERLDKMKERLDDISRMLARGNLNAFAENMRFIDLRYGSAESPFD